MRTYTRADQASRKAEEITPTPDRSSSRVQGKEKMIRGDMNPFAPLREENDDEDVEDVTMKEATTKSGGGSARKETSKKSGDDEIMKTRETFFRRYYKPKSVETEDSMGGKSESSSTSPIPSVLAVSAGTPARVSFATTTDRNVTDLNKLKPTAKEKTGDVDFSGSPAADTGGGNQKKDVRVIDISDTTGRNETELYNLKLTSGIFGSTFYMLTGFHGFHVFVGMLMLLFITLRLQKGHFTKDRHFGFEGAAWYWHFVDVVWLGLYILVYWM